MLHQNQLNHTKKPTKNTIKLNKEKECYDSLILHYQKWPIENPHFIKEIAEQFDHEEFLSALLKFKQYIYYHPHRCKYAKSKLFFDCHYVNYSDNFYRLNKKINKCLKITEKDFYISQVIACLTEILVCLQKFIKEHPIQATLYLFIGFIILNAYAAPVTQNNKKTKNNFDNLPSDIEKAGFSIRDITATNKDCESKTSGSHEVERCNIDNTFYYIKNIQANTISNAYNNPLNSINQKQIIDYAKIKTPNLYFFSEKINNKKYYYLASEEIKDFVTAKSLTPHQLKKFLNSKDNIAKLAVANTLMSDLYDMNYGFVMKTNELAIVDFDMQLNGNDDGASPNEKFILYLEHGLLQLKDKFTNVPPLSKQDVEKMLQIYRELETRPFPHRRFMFDIEPETYKQIIQFYIELCQHVLIVLNDAQMTKTFKETIGDEPNLVNLMFYHLGRQLIDYKKPSIKNEL